MAAPFKLTAMEAGENCPPSIRIYIRNSMKKIATIWGDGTFEFDGDFNFRRDELKSIMRVEKQFFTIFNSLIEKDKEIQLLQSPSPVLERYTAKTSEGSLTRRS